MIYSICPFKQMTVLLRICAILSLITFSVWPYTCISTRIYYGHRKCLYLASYSVSSLLVLTYSNHAVFFNSLLAVLNNHDALQETQRLNKVMILSTSILSQMNNMSRGKNPDYPPAQQLGNQDVEAGPIGSPKSETVERP